MPGKRRKFAERREIVGHSQETLARFVGVEPTTVGRWEGGETVPHVVLCLAQVEGVQLAASRFTELPDGSVRLEATNPVLLWGRR